jgi:hypothetical protein
MAHFVLIETKYVFHVVCNRVTIFVFAQIEELIKQATTKVLSSLSPHFGISLQASFKTAAYSFLLHFKIPDD